ncbi:MAG: hypothetical protein KAS04_07260 [Candidatus Aenigmarchaeota archaeon]|nr:hypothetical protein [Candidatus Aenigmarchaeota archaeon]
MKPEIVDYMTGIGSSRSSCSRMMDSELYTVDTTKLGYPLPEGTTHVRIDTFFDQQNGAEVTGLKVTQEKNGSITTEKTLRKYHESGEIVAIPQILKRIPKGEPLVPFNY